MSGAIRLSVALVTRNRLDLLERCLKDWKAQTRQPDELVVSDDSDFNLEGEMRSLVQRYGGNYVRGPRRGLYANRNCASLACTGTHIMSADDDHLHNPDFLEKVVEVVAQAPERIWIFGEKNPKTPDEPIQCPSELHRSGHGQGIKNPDDCEAIADGSSVYPRAVFDQGLRYDESYSFGALWYLWGKHLVRRGWRISFSDRTFVWHAFPEHQRGEDAKALAVQLQSALYSLWVNALWLNPSFSSLFWTAAYSFRNMIVPQSIVGFSVAVRLTPGQLFSVLQKALAARRRYSRKGRTV